MKVLFVTWEVAPFFKVGGLGDISRSLPRALQHSGIDIRIITPYYKAFKLLGQKRKKIGRFSVVYDNKKTFITIYQISFLETDIPVYLLENHRYLDSPMIDTFAVFDLAVAAILKNNYLSWMPDIVHCNDLHTGFIPFLIKHMRLPVKTLLTIHNLAHQGRTSINIVEKMGIDPKKCRLIRWEIKNKRINFLLEGIIHADLVNTVSPTYAKEIMTKEYGQGLDDILRAKERKIFGILNGIDYDIRNPSTDDYIPYHYNLNGNRLKNKEKIYSYEEGKRLNKAYLQKKLGFKVDHNIPLIGFIGRFASHQKGIEIIHKMLMRLDLKQYQFVFLGQGEEEWEQKFLWIAKFNPKHVFYSSEFDEKLASLIYASCDFLLIPSQFEPCGLVQMIAMKYGTLPIARATGGLKDSIVNGKDGFLFEKYSSHDLEKKLKLAISIWKEKPKKYKQMVKTAINKNFSWDASAQKYIEIYQRLLKDNTL